MGEWRNAYTIWVGKPEEKIPLVRHRKRWEDNIRINIKEVGWEGVDGIHLGQDRDQCLALVVTVMNFQVV
jgi:hypothetical protein